MKKPLTTAAPLAIGTGLIALDVVLSDNRPDTPRYWAGGTCGNVLSVLRYLGWRAAPVARLRDGEAASQLLSDLRRWGVSEDFISLADDGSTPVIVQRIRHISGGDPYHTFSWRCPKCGSRLPGYKAVLATDAEEIGKQLQKPRVFFFDRLSRGALLLARRCADLGAAVVFEPSSVGNPAQFREAWGLADVIKYSHERLHKLPADLEAECGPRLQIETHGKDGLRYRTRLPGRQSRAWYRLDALPAPRVRDTAGAGDWCTAGIIHKLFLEGAVGLNLAIDTEVREALLYGQALATWACGYEGARGGMYEVDKDLFKCELAALLGKVTKIQNAGNGSRLLADRDMVCLCPSYGEAKKTPIRPRKTGDRLRTTQR